MKRRGGGSRPEVDCAGVLQSAEIAVIFVNFAGFFLFQAFRIPNRFDGGQPARRRQVKAQ